MKLEVVIRTDDHRRRYCMCWSHVMATQGTPCKLVSPAGFEPAVSTFEAWRRIRWNHGEVEVEERKPGFVAGRSFLSTSCCQLALAATRKHRPSRPQALPVCLATGWVCHKGLSPALSGSLTPRFRPYLIPGRTQGHRRSVFCCTVPSRYRAWPLARTLLCVARTFLCMDAAIAWSSTVPTTGVEPARACAH